MRFPQTESPACGHVGCCFAKLRCARTCGCTTGLDPDYYLLAQKIIMLEDQE